MSVQLRTSKAPERDVSTCPRCGDPVTYKGRGRRPIWCSTLCRVEASIERKGNRLAGVQPKVVKVVRVKEIEAPAPPPPPSIESAIRMVAASPWGVHEVLTRTALQMRMDPSRWSDAIEVMGSVVAHGNGPEPSPGVLPQRPGRRPIQDWTNALAELRSALTSGAVYRRELQELRGPLEEMIHAYNRESGFR